MEFKSRYPGQEKDVAKGAIIAAICFLLFSSYQLFVNFTFINPYLEITGKIVYAEADTRIEKRSRRGTIYTVYLSEILFKLKGNNRSFRLTSDVTYNPGEQKYYELEKQLKKSKAVTVLIQSFDKEETEPKVFGLSIDGEQIKNPDDLKSNEALFHVAIFAIGLIISLFSLKVLRK
jgi:hypothetical protein